MKEINLEKAIELHHTIKSIEQNIANAKEAAVSLKIVYKFEDEANFFFHDVHDVICINEEELRIQVNQIILEMLKAQVKVTRMELKSLGVDLLPSMAGELTGFFAQETIKYLSVDGKGEAHAGVS